MNTGLAGPGHVVVVHLAIARLELRFAEQVVDDGAAGIGPHDDVTVDELHGVAVGGDDLL